ncbi:MAG: hypothetical protein HY898_15880 [Deltaproteobacteria bacterium]|nr:hypothetical protein [Deltaproteobacteria bacterium]
MLLTPRLVVTLADALVELAQWGLAARVHEAAFRSTPDGTLHPIGAHAAIQRAFCLLMQGSTKQCREALALVDTGMLESMGDMIITFGAEHARYLAVEAACNARERAVGDGAVRSMIAARLDSVRIIGSRIEESRTQYLRNLFCWTLSRDISTILGLLPAGP